MARMGASLLCGCARVRAHRFRAIPGLEAAMTRVRQRARRWVFGELDRLIGQRQSTEPKELSADPENQAKTRET